MSIPRVLRGNGVPLVTGNIRTGGRFPALRCAVPVPTVKPCTKPLWRRHANSGVDGSIDESMRSGSEEWRTRPSSIQLTGHAQTPESWLVLVVFLKVVFYGTLWPHSLLYMVPASVGLLMLTKYILDKGINRRRGFIPVLFAGAIIAALLSKLITG